MLLLHQPSLRSDDRASRFVLVFGAGLIGNSVVNSLRSFSEWDLELLPFSWSDSALQLLQFDGIRNRIEKWAASDYGTGCGSRRIRLGVLWSAGCAGFAASDCEVAEELRSHSAVTHEVERLSEKISGPTVFHQVSSAGGLFEGQRVVNDKTEACWLRPYGRLKHLQEQNVRRMNAAIVKRTYRLSSVIGPATGPYRRG